MKSICLAAILVVWTISCFQTTEQMEIVYAVNCGGDAYTDSNGINYQKDTSTEGSPYTFPFNINGINDHDRVIYQTCLYHVSSLSYDLPLNGDGWYGLLLHLADDSHPIHERRLEFKLNGQHILLDLDFIKDCGRHHVCNQIFYFKVCQGTLYYEKQTSTLCDVEKVNLDIKVHAANALINGILLVKGELGEAMSIVGTKTVFFIDPKNKTKCNVSRCVCKSCPGV
jgi:Malectin domain